MRTIDADKLTEEFKRRHRAALRWKEEALNRGNEESFIRADAVLGFLSEVKLTIDNAPTIEPDDYISKTDLINFIRSCHESLFEKMKEYTPQEFEIRENMLLNFEQIVRLADMRGGKK